jgi:hypothetical protein
VTAEVVSAQPQSSVPLYGMQLERGPPAAVPLPPGLVVGETVDRLSRTMNRRGLTIVLATCAAIAVGLAIWFAVDLVPHGGTGWLFMVPLWLAVSTLCIYVGSHDQIFEFDRPAQELRYHLCFLARWRRTQTTVVPFADFGDLSFPVERNENNMPTRCLLDYRGAAANKKLVLERRVEDTGFSTDELRLQWATYFASLSAAPAAVVVGSVVPQGDAVVLVPV